jgi:hypothetical protein
MAETVKKTRTAAKPRKATNSGNGASADPMVPNHRGAQKQHSLAHDEVARLAHSYWQQRGGQHGHHMEDWFRAEQELRGKVA